MKRTYHQYLTFLRRAGGLSPATLDCHRHHILPLLRFVRRRGLRCWSKLSVHQLDAFQRWYKPKAARSYRASIQYTLRRFLRYLHFRGIIDRPLDRLVMMPRIYSYEKLPRFLTAQQVKRLLAVIDQSKRTGRRDYAVILLMLSTGIRARECVNLTLEDVDWRGRLLRVEPTKTRTARLVPIPPAALEALAAYLKRDRPPTTRTRSLFLIYGPNSDWRRDPAPLTYTTLGRVVRDWLKRAGLRVGSSCYALRHTYAQHLLDRGAGYPTLQALLGHRSLHTIRFYARVNFSELREVADNDAEKI